MMGLSESKLWMVAQTFRDFDYPALSRGFGRPARTLTTSW